MKASSILAIYTLFWSMCFFFVLPFRLRSSAEPDHHVAGQADSAPPRFSLKRTAWWTTWVSLVFFLIYYVNYVEGWLRPEMFDISAGR